MNMKTIFTAVLVSGMALQAVPTAYAAGEHDIPGGCWIEDDEARKACVAELLKKIKEETNSGQSAEIPPSMLKKTSKNTRQIR